MKRAYHFKSQNLSEAFRRLQTSSLGTFRRLTTTMKRPTTQAGRAFRAFEMFFRASAAFRNLLEALNALESRRLITPTRRRTTQASEASGGFAEALRRLEKPWRVQKPQALEPSGGFPEASEALKASETLHTLEPRRLTTPTKRPTIQAGRAFGIFFRASGAFRNLWMP